MSFESASWPIFVHFCYYRSDDAVPAQEMRLVGTRVTGERISCEKTKLLPNRESCTSIEVIGRFCDESDTPVGHSFTQYFDQANFSNLRVYGPPDHLVKKAREIASL